LAFAAVLATGFITSMGSTSDTARVNNVKVFFIDGMNNAITQCYLAASSAPLESFSLAASNG
jgi:hypothetical protein